MNAVQSCKCVLSFLWTNALVVAALVFLLFSFIDPGDIAAAILPDEDEGVFRIKAYIFSFVFLWLVFNASTFLNHYFSHLRRNKYLHNH